MRLLRAVPEGPAWRSHGGGTRAEGADSVLEMSDNVQVSLGWELGGGGAVRWAALGMQEGSGQCLALVNHSVAD